MSKPMIHARSDVKRYGGKVTDYLPVHDFMDSSKAHVADHRHRALFHNSYGPFVCERIFGHSIVNSDGREVSIRDIAENHIIDDLGWIPSVQDYLSLMEKREWMGKKRIVVPDISKLKIYTKDDKGTLFKPSIKRDRSCHKRTRQGKITS